MKKLFLTGVLIFSALIKPGTTLALSLRVYPEFLTQAEAAEFIVEAKIIEKVEEDTPLSEREGYYKLVIQKSWRTKAPAELNLYFSPWGDSLKVGEVYLLNLTKKLSENRYQLDGSEQYIAESSSAFIPAVNQLNSKYLQPDIPLHLYDSKLLTGVYIATAVSIFIISFILLHKQFSRIKESNHQNQMNQKSKASSKAKKIKTPLPKTSNPAQNALATIDVYYLEDLTKYTEKEILDLHGMGPKAIRILKEAMASLGISFKEDK